MQKCASNKKIWLLRAFWQNQLRLKMGITSNPAISHLELQEDMRKDVHCITVYIINKSQETAYSSSSKRENG